MIQKSKKQLKTKIVKKVEKMTLPHSYRRMAGILIYIYIYGCGLWVAGLPPPSAPSDTSNTSPLNLIGGPVFIPVWDERVLGSVF